MSFNTILNKHREEAYSQANKGTRFENLMRSYLLTDPTYALRFQKIWLWNDFPFKKDLGAHDSGIDLVVFTTENEYWAIQCKCYKEDYYLDKKGVDSFLSTSGRSFQDEQRTEQRFSNRLFISTTNKWSANAQAAIQHQNPPVNRINLSHLQEAPVDWEKLDQGLFGDQCRTGKKTPRKHQEKAVELVHNAFKKADRGKLIMACGTGKTYTALQIAEKETGDKGLVLFLMPSIALLGQTLREWSGDAERPIEAICICSDPRVNQKKTEDDYGGYTVVDLALPASTRPDHIVHQLLLADRQPGMTVVFSTYQSIEVISNAQKKYRENNPDQGIFDLIICDEAHRTTGVTLAGEDESAFVKVHDNDFLVAKKRLYMTATPRLYSPTIKNKADEASAVLCSMDDEKHYGKELYRIGFGEAVEKALLTDYKVLVLTLNESNIPPAIQKMISDKEQKIDVDDAAKLIGCINALSKQVLGDEGIIRETDPDPMKRGVAFCQSIKVSKKVTATFNNTTQTYIHELPEEKQQEMVHIAAQHIDGTMNAPKREELLSWLKADAPESRILTNVRCLSEGVDVPSLDSVMFLSARNSEVDVVQSVGRVMRRSEGKKYGYIIIPVIIPSAVTAHEAMDDNTRYKVVWTVLNALRAHDDRFNATVNKIELNKKKPENIIVGGADTHFDEDGNPYRVETGEKGPGREIARQMMLDFEELQGAVFARMVTKVGDRIYWEQWAKSVAEIAQRQQERIKRMVSAKGKHQKKFEAFLNGLHKNINPSISEDQAIEMLSQHIITQPVFEALFENYSFVRNNPISQSMQAMLELLEKQAIKKDTANLQRFYDSVKLRANGIDNAEAKQRIIIELYDKFFKTAFPRMVEQLGIVYTPVEVVDFIIHSINDVLKSEFGRNIGDENIHILDPFTGTGTFITRLIQSGLIAPEDMERKYSQEIHANEIVLLAYYIAAVNIENAYHDLMGEQSAYKSFQGICLTDTFQLGETKEGEELFSEMFPQNSERVQKQQKAPLRVIMGNPPYSVGQKNANDNAQNLPYPQLDGRIAKTYAKDSNARSLNSLYDSYIKAFRWASDRLDESNGGVICFVSNGSWIDGNAQDGFRRHLEEEFSSVYVFNLRGNARTQGELRRREAGNVFGSGSRTPIAITVLVKKGGNGQLNRGAGVS